MEEDDSVFLHIKNSEVIAEYMYEQRKHVKSLSIEDVANLLSKDIKLDTGYLHLAGENFIGIRRYMKFGSTEIVFMESSPQTHPINFDHERNADNNETFGIQCPTFYFASIIQEGREIESMAFACKMPVVGNTIELFRFPLGNVGNEGGVCWGVNRNITQITGSKFNLLGFFLHSPFNRHLGFQLTIPEIQEPGRDMRRLVTHFRENPILDHENLLHQRLDRNDRCTAGNLVDYLVRTYVRENRRGNRW